jgi:hypothetical protein
MRMADVAIATSAILIRQSCERLVLDRRHIDVPRVDAPAAS